MVLGAVHKLCRLGRRGRGSAPKTILDDGGEVKLCRLFDFQFQQFLKFRIKNAVPPPGEPSILQKVIKGWKILKANSLVFIHYIYEGFAFFPTRM